MTFRSGRHFLQIPGPTNVPGRVLRAMARATIDHRGPEFFELTREVVDGLRDVFENREGHPVLYPASGSGGWEAAIANVLAPGDRVLAFDQGFFADGWCRTARQMGIEVDVAPGDWRRPVDPELVQSKLLEPATGPSYRAILVVHNETTTGVRSNIGEIRHAIDRVGHDALLMVDAVSSLGSMPFRQDEWRVDVVVAGSQKGLMLPPGLAINSVSRKALLASEARGSRRAYWDWGAVVKANDGGSFPYTPPTNLLFGLREALTMFREEGKGATFARHERLAAATRAAVAAWGLETYCADAAAHSSSVTAVVVPEGSDADDLRRTILDAFDMSLGKGLGKLERSVFRIGHLGDLNDLTLVGTLGGIEMGMRLAGVPHSPGGVTAALESLAAAVSLSSTR